eukprot:GHVL01019222.1.p1 GENE.GHVL01019222.1~~GHVL01019222.1.p1  ORF type:complete len:148 (+),score=40.73 GHVL01019222.1:35-478(+)
MTEQQIAEWTEAFDVTDTNKNGVLSPFDISIALKSLGFNTTNDEMDEIIDEYDVYSSGGIKVEDFIEILQDKVKKKREIQELKEAFELFDHVGNGYVPIEIFRNAMKSMGTQPYDDNEFTQLMAEIKIDGGGMFKYSELLEKLICSD